MHANNNNKAKTNSLVTKVIIGFKLSNTSIPTLNPNLVLIIG